MGELILIKGFHQISEIDNLLSIGVYYINGTSTSSPDTDNAILEVLKGDNSHNFIQRRSTLYTKKVQWRIYNPSTKIFSNWLE